MKALLEELMAWMLVAIWCCVVLSSILTVVAVVAAAQTGVLGW